MAFNTSRNDASVHRPRSPVVQTRVTPPVRSNAEKTHHLCKETGMESVMAEEFLSSNGWNLEEAIRGYKALVAHEEKLRPKQVSDQQQQQLHQQQQISSQNSPPTPSVTMETLQVSDQKENGKERRKASRGFSVSNLTLLHEEREKQKQASCEVTRDDAFFELLNLSSKTSFILPDISKFEKDVIEVVKDDLISRVTLNALTATGRLNWWTEIGACRKLFPMSTVGDGNCLLHAVSLGMWGFHDRMLTLRKALYTTLQHPFAKKGLKRRWKYDLWKENMNSGCLQYTMDEWEKEWNTIVQLSCDKPYRVYGDSANKPRRINRQYSVTELEDGESLDSLEAIHVYVLANLLCRPIIVLAEEMLRDHEGRPVAPIPFGGIYLPLERNPDICFKYPLILAYEQSHFSALVPADGDNMLLNGEKISSSVPIVDKNFYLLPIKYITDPGCTWDSMKEDGIKEEKPELKFQEKITLLRQYLEVVKVSAKIPSKKEKDYRVGTVLDHFHDMISKGQNTTVILAAKLNVKNRPKHYQEMIDNFLENVKDKVRQQRASEQKARRPSPASQSNHISAQQHLASSPPISSDKMVQRSCAANSLDDRSTSNHNVTNSSRNSSTAAAGFALADGIHKMTINHPDESHATYQNEMRPPQSQRYNDQLDGINSGNSRLGVQYQQQHQQQQHQQQQHQQQNQEPYYQNHHPQQQQQKRQQHQDSYNPISHEKNALYYPSSTSASISDQSPRQPQDPSRTQPVSLPYHPSVPTQLRINVQTDSTDRRYLPSTVQSEQLRTTSNGIGTPCRTHGCKFYGNAQTSGFCSSCYRKYQRTKGASNNR